MDVKPCRWIGGCATAEDCVDRKEIECNEMKSKAKMSASTNRGLDDLRPKMIWVWRGEIWASCEDPDPEHLGNSDR